MVQVEVERLEVEVGGQRGEEVEVEG